MKKIFFSFLLLLAANIFCHAQNAPISFDGLYIAKTGDVPAAGVSIHTYLRFYKDGTVCLQAVSVKEPQTVAGWFGRYKKFSQKGTYQVNGKEISISVDNKESEDFKLEGLEQTTFKGTIAADNKLCMKRDKEPKEFCFDFFTVKDTTKFKYTSYKPEIMLPGEWKVKQVLKNSKQVIFGNGDSTDVGIAVHKQAGMPGYKEGMSDFEVAFAYYEWDSKYMKDEEKMEVTKISENRANAFVVWHAKDANNDMYFLFGKSKELVYNIMIADKDMPLDKKLALLEAIFNLNK